jgi:hypothetical protein
MKNCPRCKANYTDETLSFCLQDGTPLVAFLDEAETVISSKNQMLNSFQTNSDAKPFSNSVEVPEQKKSRTLLVVFATILLTSLLLGAIGIGSWFYLRPNQPLQVTQNTNVNQASTPNINIATPTPTSTPTPKPTVKPAELAGIKKDVEQTIIDWKTASEDFDLDGNVSNYADTVDYYTGGKVSKSKIKQDKQKAYSTYDTININISEIKITPDPSGEKATAVFNKEWDFATLDKKNRGEVTQQIIFSKVGGKWKIISEKDLKVLWIDRGKNKPDDNIEDESTNEN